MKITLKIKRFNPEADKEPFIQDFDIDVEPTDRVLDALVYVKAHLDSTLGFRKSCAHGICGSDAMLINGSERLACKTLIKDVTDAGNTVIQIEPLRSMQVRRDLIVDQAPFFDNYRAVKPYLIADKYEGEGERRQTPEDRAHIDDSTNCILCASCYSSCPVVGENPDFIGPASVVQAARFVLDSRDTGFEDRLDILDSPGGVWPCENHFNCTRACPRGIKVTKHINEMKRTIKARAETDDQDS